MTFSAKGQLVLTDWKKTFLYEKNFPIYGQSRGQNRPYSYSIGQCPALLYKTPLTVISCVFYLSFFLLALALDSSSSSEYSMT